MPNSAPRWRPSPTQLVALGILMLFIAVVGTEIVLLVGQVGQAGTVWGVLLWTALGLLGAGLAWAMSRECLGYLRVRRVDTLRRRAGALNSCSRAHQSGPSDVKR